jgi:hypothetical protein
VKVRNDGSPVAGLTLGTPDSGGSRSVCSGFRNGVDLIK